MGKLADCIKKHPGISEIEAQTMIERSDELTKGGMSDQAAARKILEEYRSEIDNDFDSLRKQLKVKVPSVKERTAARKAITDKAVQDVDDKYKAELAKLETPKKEVPKGKPAAGKADVKAGDRIAPSGIQKTDHKGRVVRPKPIITIFADLQKNINKLVKSIGQMKYTKDPIPGRRGIIGAFSPFYRTIAMKTVGDLDTAAHELGHAMDEAYGLQNKLPNEIAGDVFKELKPFIKHGSPVPSGHPNPSEYELSEGIAEWVRAYMMNPVEAIEAAPVFHEWYQATLPTEAQNTMDEFSSDIRILYGASSFDIINASVEIVPDKSFTERLKETANELLETLKPQSRNPRDFKVTWVDKIKQKFVDSMHPWDATVRFAARVGNLDLNDGLASNNPLIMARLFLGRNSKVENFMEKGLVKFNSDERVVDAKTGKEVSLDWILDPFDNSDRKTFDQEQREMIAYGIAKRTQELPLKFVEQQISAALDKGQIIPSTILYSNQRFYDKFFERNELLRQDIYDSNEYYNEQLVDKTKKTEEKINKAFAKEKAELEKNRRKQQIELDSERQKYYDQKGEIPEKTRQSKLRILKQQSIEAIEAFEQAIDKLELERFKAQQKLQGKVDAAMDKVLKFTVMANIKRPKGPFTGIGGKLIGEQALAQKTIDELEGFHPEKVARIKEALRRYRVFADNVLQYMVASGRMSQVSYDAIKANNEEYFMLQRVIEARPGEAIESFTPVSAKGMASIKEVIHRVKGSASTIKNPYEALLAFTHKAIIESDRNYVLNSYVDFMRVAAKGDEEEAGRISKIISPTVESDENKITVFRKGKKEYYQMDSYILNSMKGITDQIYSLPPIIRFFPKLLRASVTNNPVFAARNLLRDYQTMAVVSSNVKTIGDLIPKKLQDIGGLKPEDAYEVFGGGQGGYHLLSEDFYNKTMKEHSAKIAGTEGNILVKAADLAILAGESFGKLSAASEKVTRMQEFKNSFRKSKKKGLDDYNAGLKAAFDARSLMDFAIVGEWMNVINQLVPFTNAKIQGIRVAKRGFVKNPAMFALKAGLTIALPQYLIRMMYDDDEEDRYLQLPEYQRNMFWNIPVGKGWLVIPKPHDISLVSTMADMTYDKALDNKVDYNGFNTAIFALLPLSRADMAGPMRTFVEIAANKDFFRDATIAYDDKRSMERRNFVMASRLGKLIGEPIGVDPRKIDHFLRGTMSYFGNQAMRISDIGREDKKRNIADMSGFFKTEPVFTYKDVQWAQEQADLHALENEGYYLNLRWLIQEYSLMDDGGNKDMMAKSIREYSGFLRELWESNGIHEYGSSEYQEQFKEAVRKQAKKVSDTPLIRAMKKAREKRKK